MAARDWEEAVESCERVLELIDDIETHDFETFTRGEEFLEDVREKVSDMQGSIEEREFITERQLKALDNWEGGVRRWHYDYRGWDDD